MLEIEAVRCERGERTLFSNLSLSIDAGRLLRVAGANGSGKTSLLRILCGLLAPSDGEVRWDAKPIAALREEYHRELAYVGHLNGLKDELTPLENLDIAATLANAPASREARLAALDVFGVVNYASVAVRNLSQGQRRRVALARLALGSGARIWILDEPFTALDSGAVGCLQALISAKVGSGGIVVLTTHMEVAIAAASVVLVDLDRQADRA